MPKKLIIDGTEIEVDDGITLLQACELAGVEIPRGWLSDRSQCQLHLPHHPSNPPVPRLTRAEDTVFQPITFKHH